MAPRSSFARIPFTLIALAALAAPAEAGRPRTVVHEGIGHLTFASPQVDPLALSPNGALLLVANTTSNTVDAIDTASNTRVASILVGVDPVSVAFRPDGLEAWVANHVSDSVSVVDTDPTSTSYLRVVETIQSFGVDFATSFDEPTGIAFASNTKAFVALSSTNRIAVVDAVNYAVTGTILITAQDPRAIAVANGRLYVAAFESGNQSEVSTCANALNNNPQCTLGAFDLATFATNPNMPGEVKNIVIDPQVPDRDVFAFDASTHAPLKTTSGVGTLLYDIAVDAADTVFVTQTDARNTVNGIVGSVNNGNPNNTGRQDPNGDGDVNLADLDNRMFTNELAILNCSGGASACTIASIVNLDGSGPGDALATPYGLAISGDGARLVATAAGTNRVFAMNSSGTLLAQLDVGAIPRGIALRSVGGVAQTAYVLNSLDNTVSVVDVSDPSPPITLSLVATIPVGNDPTPPAVRRGAIAFNSAFASNTGTFSCGSCHPDANTDQLLWRIGGECSTGIGCIADEDEPRSTMPIRGLRDSVPLHWDGTLGDPFGGPDGSVGSGGNTGTSCSAGNQHGCFRHLVDGSLSGVMCERDPTCANGPSGLPGLLTVQEREDMASFLEQVSYPPARMRRMSDALSRAGQGVTIANPANAAQFANVSATEGFKDFFMNKGGAGQPDTCADSDAGCHELPLGTATNSETLEAFDAPTMRGMTDRFLQFSLGPTGSEEILNQANTGLVPLASGLETPIRWNPSTVGHNEVTTFGAAFLIFQPVYNVRPLDIWQMFEEASTGTSGATGRQVTLNSRTTNGALAAGTNAVLDRLEAADARGVVNLRGTGLASNGAPVVISYLSGTAQYQFGGLVLTRAALVADAQAGNITATLTGHLRSGVDEANPQPLLASVGANCFAPSTGTGDPGLPFGTSFTIEGRHVVTTDRVFVDGQPDAGATIGVTPGASCSTNTGLATDTLLVTLGSAPATGMHLLQVQSGTGLLSNELPFCVGSAGDCNN
jgi:YVTN family beta-propeller protein